MCLVSLAGVVLILQRGRVPIIAFGMPLLLPAMKSAGLVPFSPIRW